MQSREPSQEEQGAGLGEREEPLPPSAFPDILKQLPPLTPQTVPTHGPQRELEEDRGRRVGDLLPFVGTLKALLTITSLTALILLNEE